MKHQVYSVFDAKAGFYNKPFYLVNDQVLERAIVDLLLDPNTDIHRHPEDFIVYKLGEYDDETGSFVLPEPQVMYRCIELKVKVENMQSKAIEEQAK